MSYLSDYIHYSSGTEVPDEYLQWGGLSILGHVLGKKCWIEHGEGYFRFTPETYIALVGEAGSGKNTALNVNIRIMLNHFPDLMLSASVQSREDIAWQMGEETPTNPHTWRQPDGQIITYRPFYILNEELNNLLSVDKIKMMSFLIQLFDGEQFSTGFKKDRLANPTRKQWFANPFVSLLAGAVPEWFMTDMKMDLFSTGMGRRMIIVNARRTKVVPFPFKPVTADAAMTRVIAHLKQAYAFTGGAYLNEEAKRFWEPWYIKTKKEIPLDPILAQFNATKPMQVLKIALLLLRSESLESNVIECAHLEMAVHMIDKLEPGIIKLTSGIGRNELAGIGAQMLDFIERMDGMVTEVQLKKTFHRYMNLPETKELLQLYSETGQLLVHKAQIAGIERFAYFTPDGYQNFIKKRDAHLASGVNGAIQTLPVSGQAPEAGPSVVVTSPSGGTPLTSVTPANDPPPPHNA